MKKPSEGYPLQFWLLCSSSFLFFASFNIMIPELPLYLENMGGGEYKGLLIALFTLTAGFARPFSGKLADSIGRIPVMIYGSLVCVVCGLIYPFALVVWGLLLTRVLHGFSTGFKPTGTSAYIGDLVHPTRRGEAIGLNGVFSNIGMAAAPVLGAYLVNNYSYNAMFFCSSILALGSVVVLMGMKETVPVKQKFKWSLLKISFEDVFEPKVLLPFILVILCVFSYGIVLTVIPDFSLHLGIKNKGLFFTTFTIASLAVRFFAGKASDRYGRILILKYSTLLLAFSLFYMGLVTTPFELLLSAAVFGVANGIVSPALFAWAIDLSDPLFRGRAMATVYIGLEAGIGLGALISGMVRGDDPGMFRTTFWVGSLLGVVAFIVLLIGKNKQKTDLKKVRDFTS